MLYCPRCKSTHVDKSGCYDCGYKKPQQRLILCKTAKHTGLYKLYRAGIHVPLGILNGYFLIVGLLMSVVLGSMPMPVFWAFTAGGIVLAILFAVGFIFGYEINEDWHLKDGAYLDMVGWLVGLPIPFGAFHLWILMIHW